MKTIIWKVKTYNARRMQTNNELLKAFSPYSVSKHKKSLLATKSHQRTYSKYLRNAMC